MQHKETLNTTDLLRSDETRGDHALQNDSCGSTKKPPSRTKKYEETPPDEIWVEHNPTDPFDGLTIEPTSFSQDEVKARGSSTEKGMMEFPQEADVLVGHLPQTCNSKGDDHHHGQENPDLEPHKVAPRTQVYGHEREVRQGCLLQTSERRMVRSMSETDRTLRLKAEKAGENGLKPFMVRVIRPIMSLPKMCQKNGLLGPRGLEITKEEYSRLIWDRGKPDKGSVEGEVRLAIAPVLIVHLGVLIQ